MKNVMERERKRCEEMRLAGMIWWLILWYASDEGKLEIPSEQEWLSCELVATIVEETTGEKFNYSWCHDEFGRERHQQWNAWPEYLNRAMERPPRKLPYFLELTHPKCIVLDLLKRFIKYRFTYERDDKWYESDLSLFHKEHTPLIGGRSRFKPEREMYRQAVEYVSERQQCFGFNRIELLTDWLGRIGIQVMRPYIERDIAYIKVNRSR